MLDQVPRQLYWSCLVSVGDRRGESRLLHSEIDGLCSAPGWLLSSDACILRLVRTASDA